MVSSGVVELTHAAAFKPRRQIAGDIARAIVGQKPGPMNDIGLVEISSLQGQVQSHGPPAPPVRPTGRDRTSGRTWRAECRSSPGSGAPTGATARPSG